MSVSLAGFGLGGLGLLELELLDDMEDVQIVAGADPAADAREDFRETFDAPAYETIDELLADHDPDAVSIASVHSVHYEQALACIEREIAVHVEKPMTTTLVDALKLEQVAAEADAVVQVGYQRHFDPRYRELRERIADDEIGDPHFVDCHLEQRWTHATESWRGNPDLSGGGFLYDSGSHLIDVLCWTLDAEPVAVSAMTDDRETGVDINSALAVELEREESSITASVALSGAGTTGPEVGDSLDIYGTDGRIAYADDGVLVTDAEGESESVVVGGDTEFVPLTEAKLQNWIDAVRDEAEVAVPPEHGVRAIALTEAAAIAAEHGERVDVQELIEEVSG